MVVVTISILVTHPLLEEILPEVRSVVLLPLEELVLSEVVERSSKRKSEGELADPSATKFYQWIDN